jgi:predicted nucleic acid-binding protein
MNYLLDTNVISELISRQPNTKVIDWLDSLDSSTVFLSVITIGEIRKGIEKLPPSERRETLSTWLETDLLLRFQGHIVEITTEVMLVWGVLVAQLESKGQPIPAIDSLIAASALQGGYTLVTRNEDDFLPTGVPVINPWK